MKILLYVKKLLLVIYKLTDAKELTDEKQKTKKH